MKEFKNLVKRNMGKVLLTLLVLTALTGCGSSKTVQSQAETTAAANTEQTSQTEQTTQAESADDSSALSNVSFDENGNAVVVHSYGTTVVPKNPQRIISIKMEDLLLALDVDFVAGRNFEGFYLEDMMKERNIASITVDESTDTVNYEEILSYEPDLIIIRDSFNQTFYDELSKIAPTVAFDLQDKVNSTLAIGAMLGMEDKAEARIQQYNDFMAKTKDQLKDAIGDDTVAMLRFLKKEIRIYPYSTNHLSDFLYSDLGLTPDPMVIEADSADNLAMSMESLPELKADRIILIAGYGSASQDDIDAAKIRYEEISQDPLWQNVPAVQSGNIYEMDSRIWLNHGLLCTEMKAQELLDAFSGK